MVCLGETPNSILTEMRLAKIVNFVVNYKGRRKCEIDKDLDLLRDADTRILEVMNHVSPGIVIWMWCQSLSGYQKLKKHGFLKETVSKLFKDMHFTTLELERLRIDEEKRTEGEVLTGWWQWRHTTDAGVSIFYVICNNLCLHFSFFIDTSLIGRAFITLLYNSMDLAIYFTDILLTIHSPFLSSKLQTDPIIYFILCSMSTGYDVQWRI